MASLCAVGQVAEWFKATVLKTVPGIGLERHKSYNLAVFALRISRCSRTVPRNAMARNSAQRKQAGMRLQPHPALGATKERFVRHVV